MSAPLPHTRFVPGYRRVVTPETQTAHDVLSNGGFPAIAIRPSVQWIGGRIRDNERQPAQPKRERRRRARVLAESFASASAALYSADELTCCCGFHDRSVHSGAERGACRACGTRLV